MQTALAEGPLSVSDLRRRLPSYGQTLFEPLVQEHIAKGKLHRHPRCGRFGERVGLKAADPRDYLRSEFSAMFIRLEHLGFGRGELLEGGMDLLDALKKEEWAPTADADVPAEDQAAAVPSEGQPETPAAADPVETPFSAVEPAGSDRPSLMAAETEALVGAGEPSS